MISGIVSMTRRVKSQWLTWVLVAACSFVAQAADNVINEDVVERYEQILERAPVEGPSFEKLLQIYQEGDGLEKLDERWTPWSTQPGAKGATYSLLRGLLADRMGKTDAARKLLQAATQTEPDDFHGWQALGDFEVRQGKWADAIAAFQKGLATNVTGDDRLGLYRKLGQAQQRNLDVSAALATWQKMVEEFPKDSFALEEAGGAQLDAEQFDEAKKTFQKLVDLTEPNSMARVQALMHLAEVDDRQGKTDAAVHDYEAILPLTADGSWLNRELRAQIEQVYRREDDLAGLVTYYQKWTQDNPKDVEALLLLAGTLNELGKKPEALDVLRKVTVLAPDRHEVRQSFAQALVEAKQYDEAISVLNALTADDPTEPRYWETLGDALWLKTQPPTPESKKATLDAWAHIAPADSKEVAAILRVADLSRDHDLNDEALAGYQRALALSPDANDIREKAVKLLVDLKREDEAWKLLDQMTDGNLATAANFLKLATLDQQFDRKDAQEQAIQKGLALEPANFDLLSMEWTRLAEAQKWSDCVALFDKLMAAAPNAYFADQLELRQLQALTSAGMLDDTAKNLRAKLGADPGMSESDLRLLLRILIQKSDPDVTKALDEAHRRFPQSVSLLQIEADYDRHVGNDDGAVGALQKLIEIAPQQKSDWLSGIVRIRRGQGNFDDALKTAQQIIDASPASADGYLVYAEIALAANKPDAAVEKMQAAIKLSDKPNDVRQRLARYYLDAGQAAKARTIYDEAFTAADNPQDKLAIVKAMTLAYFQDGQIDTLINRFKKEQSSEEGGWRYGLYLSAIDEQMEDYGAARRELAKSLVIRPKDTSLLHSLIGLADKENDAGALLHYREMLATADPSDANEIALANEYAVQNKPEDAWKIVQDNQASVVKDPAAWKDVLNQITDPVYAAKIKDVLEESIRSKGDSFEGKFALVQFQMQQGDLDGAKGTLWDIVAQPLPPAASAGTAPPPATPKSALPLSVYNVYQGPMMQRAQQSYMAINEAQQLYAAGKNRGSAQVQMGRMRGFNRSNGVSTTLDAAGIKDHSLVYLAFISVQQKQTTEFLNELVGKIADWHWSISERLTAYSMIQAREPLLETIEEQVKAPPDKDVDQFSYMALQGFESLPTDDPMRLRADAAQAVLTARLASDPQFKNFTTMMAITRLGADTSPAGVAKRNAVVADYVKTLDHKDPAQLIQAIGLFAQVGNWPEIKKTVDELAEIDPATWSVGVAQQLNFLPQTILQQATINKEVMPKEVLPVVLELMRLSYPATPPHPALSSGTSGMIGAQVNGSYIVLSGRVMAQGFNPNMFPPANRYFPQDRAVQLEPMYQQLKARGMLPAMYAALDQEEKDFTDWRKIYPQLMRIYFQWWDGGHDEAIASVRKLIEEDPLDDWKMLLAAMLAQDQKFADAIPVLESVSARYGPDYILVQKLLLHDARQAKDNDEGQKAGMRLLALHLPQQDQMQILDDLRNVGLKDKADEIMARQNQNRAGGNAMAIMQANNQMLQALYLSSNSKDGTQAVQLARQILNHDPLAPMQFGNEASMRTQALTVLKKFDALDDYTRDLEKQLAATPDSARLNWLMGEAYSQGGDLVQETKGLLPGFHWLKLQRTGNQFAFSTSTDGTTWKQMEETELDLPPKLYVGVWVRSLTNAPATEVTMDHIMLSGKVSADASPDAALTPWSQADIGKIVMAGKAVRGKEKDSFVLTGALSVEAASGKDDDCHIVFQMLDGDGSIMARVSSIYGQPDDTMCGLCLRESLDPESRGMEAAVNMRTGVGSHSRGASGESWMGQFHSEFSTPRWLKLARVGNKFTASVATTGQDWSEIFSQQIAMNSNALAGMYIRSASNATAQWSQVTVSGTTVKTPPTGTLPPAWEVSDLGAWSIPGKASWTDTGIEVKAPAVLNSTDNNQSFGGYLLTPMTGDGEIVARLDDFNPPGHSSTTAGLTFRSDKGIKSSDIHFILAADGEASIFYKIDTQAESIRYFKRVAELSPKNSGLLVSVAEQLRHANQPDAAADIYATILKSDFTTGMNQSSNMLQVFEQTNRLPEFVKIVQDWTPQPVNPMFGGGPDMYFSLMQLSSQLKQSNHLPEAEQLLRKALTVETMQSKQDGVAALAQLLLDQGRRDEAAVEIEKWIVDKKTPTQPSVLGFGMQVQGANLWFQSMGWSQNGTIIAPIIRFLDLADAVGLSPKLKQDFQEKAGKSGSAQPGMADPNRMALVLMEIISRDPAYRADLDKLLKDFPLAGAGAGNINGYLILSQELGKWPQERPAAAKLARQAYDAMNVSPGNNFAQNVALTQVLNLARAAGDHKTIQDILQKKVASTHEQRAINPNQVPFDQVLTLIRQLIRENMLKEAADLLAEIKTDPQLLQQTAAGNSYFKLRLSALDDQLAFAKGEKSPVYLICGLSTKTSPKGGAETDIFWQINSGGENANSAPNMGHTSWYEGTNSRPTKYKIEVSAGPDDQHLVHLATFDNVATHGSAALKIPPGPGVIQAKLIVPPEIPPAATPAWALNGPILFLGGPENLLKNPDFQLSKDTSGLAMIDGWHGLLPASVSQESGGPLPSGGYQSLEMASGGFGAPPEITSERIPIQPGTDYVFSGWMRLSGNIGFRYFDAAGKTLNPNANITGANDTEWQWRSWLLKGDLQSTLPGEVIPPNAAFFQLILSPNQGLDCAGLSLRVWPVPTAK
jgi:tetratricopeptide (TPR) repeat protein